MSTPEHTYLSAARVLEGAARAVNEHAACWPKHCTESRVKALRAAAADARRAVS